MSKLHSIFTGWKYIPGSDILLGWSRELKHALIKKDELEWRIVGRAAVLISADDYRSEIAAKAIAQEAGFNFLKVESEDVLDLPPHKNFFSNAPALIYLSPGDWAHLDENDEKEDNEKKKIFYKHITKWIASFDILKPVVVLTSCYSIDELNNQISKPGSFDRYFNLPQASFKQVGEEFIHELGRELCGTSFSKSPDKLGKLLERSYSKRDQWEEAILYMRRLHRRVKRPLEFIDMMHMDVHGFGENGHMKPVDQAIRRSTAMHEAGHAIMSVIDSQGDDIPEYSSIVPGAGFYGVVASSIEFHYQTFEVEMTYARFRHRVRVALAGRAAEELANGCEHISNGASSDLESATELSYKAFSKWGFSPAMEDAGLSASNLAVVLGKAYEGEYLNIQNLVRKFLETEYTHVLNTLAAYRPLLESLAEHLLSEPIVDQHELLKIIKKHTNLDLIHK